ncbi:MAG: DUF4132 domain-containing protein [Oceanobacter sp.]
MQVINIPLMLDSIGMEITSNRQYVARRIEKLLDRNPDDLLEHMRAGHPLATNFIELIDEYKWPVLMQALLPGLQKQIQDSLRQGERKRKRVRLAEMMVGLLDRNPSLLQNLTAAQLVTVLGICSTEFIEAHFAELTRVSSKSSSKALQTAWASRHSDLDIHWLEQHWLIKPNKNLATLAFQYLSSVTTPDTPALVQTLLANGSPDQSTYDKAILWLKQKGIEVETPTEIIEHHDDPLSTLEAITAKQKRFSKFIAPFDTPATLKLMRPLSSQAARTLLHLAATEKKRSDLTRDLRRHIPIEQRSELFMLALASWIHSEGDTKHYWPVNLWQSAANDESVPKLVAVIRKWNYYKVSRAKRALEILISIGGLSVRLHLKDLATSSQLHPALRERAKITLKRIAKQQRLTLDQLYEELTPDFGLAKGVQLHVGPHQFEIQLQGDLTLRVHNKSTGRQTKSFPKIKEPELQTDWDKANQQFKQLNSNLKKVLRNQKPRITQAFQFGTSWPSDRWKRLFQQHPLLRVMGQSLIWVDNHGQSFRISEDFSLVSSDDEPYSLERHGQISLWHPANASTEETQVWNDYLSDYQLIPMVDQTNASVALLDLPQRNDGSFILPDSLLLQQTTLINLLRKFGYQQGPVGGGQRVEYWYLDIPALHLEIHLDMDDCFPWHEDDNQVQLETLRFIPQRQLRNRQIPKLPVALQATLQSHIDTLINARISQ